MAKGVLKPGTRLLALVGGALLLISIFLPWVAASELLGKELGSQSGMSVSGIIGAAGIVCGLVGIGTAFLPSPRASGVVHIVMGILALAALLAIVLIGTLPLLSEYARTLLVIREGLYLYVIAAVILIVAGSLERPAPSRPHPPVARPASPLAQVYCPACGVPNAEGSIFCESCGSRLAPQAIQPSHPSSEPYAATKKTSAAWWLMPIFLTWLGGLVAWLVVRDNDKAKAKRLLVLGIALAVFWFILMVIVYIVFYYFFAESLL